MSSICIAGFAFPFLLQTLLERYGSRWTLRIWAVAIFVFVGIAVLGLQPRLPVPKYPRGQRPRFIPPQMQFLKTSLFWLLVSTCPQCIYRDSNSLPRARPSARSCMLCLSTPSHFISPRSRRSSPRPSQLPSCSPCSIPQVSCVKS